MSKMDPRSAKLVKLVNANPAWKKIFDDNWGINSGVDRTIEDYLLDYAYRDDIAYGLAQDMGLPQHICDQLL